MKIKLSKKVRNGLYYILTFVLVCSFVLLTYTTYTYIDRVSGIQNELRSIQRQINLVISNYDDYGDALNKLSQYNYSDDSYEKVVRSSELLTASINSLNEELNKSSKSELKEYSEKARVLYNEITKLLDYQSRFLRLNYIYASANNDFQIGITVISDSTYSAEGFYIIAGKIDEHITQASSTSLTEEALLKYQKTLIDLLKLYKEYYSAVKPNLQTGNFNEIKRLSDSYTEKLSTKKKETDEVEKASSTEETKLITSVKEKITLLESTYKSLNADYK